MFKVTFAFENGSTVEAFANAGDNLLEVARSANVAIDAPCSGNGACGKCRVQLKSGELDSKKTLHISDEEFEKGWRLACMSKISADVEVLVPDIYPGREVDTGLVHARDMVEAINRSTHNALYLENFENIRDWLGENARPGDLVITVGSGNVYSQTRKLL